MISEYMKQRQQHILNGRPLKKTAPHPIVKKSEKRKQKEKEMMNDDSMVVWFEERRGEMTGTCQCGCGRKSQKNDDMFFKHCCCHIFPKSKFISIATHPLNCVERAFWGGCHGVMDDTSIDRWPGMADWEDIKAKFFLLSPLLSREERATKFFNQLNDLVDAN